MTMDTTKKILMLHGFVQLDKIFRQKTGGLRKSLKKMGYELYFPCGPEIVDKSTLVHGDANTNNDESKETIDKNNVARWFNTNIDNDTSELYGWWVRTGSGKKAILEYDIPQNTFNYLHDYIIENGPFDGIIGFSQGAGLGGYITMDINNILNLDSKQQPPLKFFISFSGFRLEPEKYQAPYEKINNKDNHVPASLHVQGELDAVVSEARVMKLYNTWPEDKRTLLKHPGSHFIPNSKPFVTQVCNWIHYIEQSNSTNLKNNDKKAINLEIKRDVRESSKNTLDDDLLDMMNSIGAL
ncbi:putative serine hydrolase PWA37_001659 [Arxiozyma heterogenica]|uniref:putative serine hydrolase n=1 Tax=Arxiozyma heterogenica TaxID=278026 RepID=UPI002EE5015E